MFKLLCSILSLLLVHLTSFQEEENRNSQICARVVFLILLIENRNTKHAKINLLPIPCNLNYISLSRALAPEEVCTKMCISTGFFVDAST